MSLANKYRPTNFNEVVEQSHIVDILKAHTSTNDRHTNYLFFGPRGTGKTTCARLLAKSLNCETPKDGNPCNECNSCKIIDQGKSMDIVEIDAASHTGVDNIRSEIIDKAGYAPVQLKMKIYIIDEVHMLSKGAFNALLKIMEEPGDKMRFILATTEIHKVPDTIISRCQVFNFKRIASNAIIERLQRIADNEDIKVSKEALLLISQMSEGCMRDAIKYLDQVSILGEVTEQNVTNFLGIASNESLEELLNTAIKAKENKDFKQIHDLIVSMQQNGVDLQQLTKQILSHIDQNLISNIEQYTLLSDVFSNIMMQSKRYPQPLLLYKTALYNYISGNNIQQQTKAPVKRSSPAPRPQIAAAAAPAPKAAPAPTQSIQPSAPSSTAPIAAPLNDSDKNDANALLTNFINAIDKPSLKSMFDDQSKISEIRGSMVDIIVINPMAKLKVKKRDILEYLEGIISDLRGETTTINFIFKTKEEFMNDSLFT